MIDFVKLNALANEPFHRVELAKEFDTLQLVEPEGLSAGYVSYLRARRIMYYFAGKEASELCIEIEQQELLDWSFWYDETVIRATA